MTDNKKFHQSQSQGQNYFTNNQQHQQQRYNNSTMQKQNKAKSNNQQPNSNSQGQLAANGNQNNKSNLTITKSQTQTQYQPQTPKGKKNNQPILEFGSWYDSKSKMKSQVVVADEPSKQLFEKKQSQNNLSIQKSNTEIIGESKSQTTSQSKLIITNNEQHQNYKLEEQPRKNTAPKELKSNEVDYWETGDYQGDYRNRNRQQLKYNNNQQTYNEQRGGKQPQYRREQEKQQQRFDQQYYYDNNNQNRYSHDRYDDQYYTNDKQFNNSKPDSGERKVNETTEGKKEVNIVQSLPKKQKQKSNKKNEDKSKTQEKASNEKKKEKSPSPTEKQTYQVKQRQFNVQNVENENLDSNQQIFNINSEEKKSPTSDEKNTPSPKKPMQRITKQDSNAKSNQAQTHLIRSKSQQQIPIGRSKKKEENKQIQSNQKPQIQPQVIAKPDSGKDLSECNCPEGTNKQVTVEKKFHKLDPQQKDGSAELLVVTIETKTALIEATIRESTNISFLNEIISLIGDFKSMPKKFKEIFLNYLNDMHRKALTQKKLQVLTTSQSIATTMSTNDQPLSQGTNYDNSFQMQNFGLSNQYNQNYSQQPMQNFNMQDIQNSLDLNSINFTNNPFQQFQMPQQNNYQSLQNNNYSSQYPMMDIAMRKESFDTLNFELGPMSGQNYESAGGDAERSSSIPLSQEKNNSGQKDKKFQMDIANAINGLQLDNQMGQGYGEYNPMGMSQIIPQYDQFGSLNTQSCNFVKNKQK